MKSRPLLGLSVVRNEADIIEAMVRHNLLFLDHMVFFDNGSIDGTFAILTALAKETGKLEVHLDRRPGHIQRKIINRFLKDNAQKYDPTQVVLLDADELICAEISRFRSLLTNTDMPVSLGWKTYVPTTSDDEKVANPVVRIVNRRSAERPQYSKTTVPGSIIGKARVTSGSHGLKSDGNRLDSVVFDELQIAHFPVRSKNQILVKALVGHWNIRLRTDNEKEGWQWHRIATKFLETGELKEDDFHRTAMMYAAKKQTTLVLDPLTSEADFDLNYLHLVQGNPLQMIAHFTEDLVMKAGR